MRKRVNYSVLFLVSLLFCSPFPGKANTLSVAEGEGNGCTEGYDLSFRDSKNNVLNLNQLKGKVVVINL
ncbi:hypothetical protein ACR784_24225 [Sphingobacterium multivorum]|uniref:hypothetical protein n=1 Tax=Sphingobacterium multivorum TaxID=28454 RepID=UPI003DA2AEE7